MNVLILGANGFLGSHLCYELSKKYNVIAFVTQGFDYSYLVNKENINCIEFTFNNIQSLDISSFGSIEFMFHMAWAGVSTSHKNEAETQVQNVIYGIKALEFANRWHIPKVIVPGSASEYACGNQIINGTNIPAPSDMYSASKVATRYVCQTYAMQHSIEFIWCNVTSIYGPGRNDNNLITYAIKTLLKKEKPSFTGLEQEWDYLYIDDLIYALVLLGERGIGGKVYPIGSGEHHKMSDYVKVIRDMIDPTLPLGIGDLPYKNKTIDNQVLDITALVEDTGFKPKFNFQQGIKETIDYFKKQGV